MHNKAHSLQENKLV